MSGLVSDGAFLRGCLPAEPDQNRRDEERHAHDQESVIKGHDVGFAPYNILDLTVSLLSGSYGIVPFI